ncbi:MAG: hypothetical protein ACRCWG_11845 [Sarcina sp.]
MLFKVKDYSLVKLVKYEIDKLSMPIILGLIATIALQVAYKLVALSRHLGYQKGSFLEDTYNKIDMSEAFRTFFGGFYGVNISFFIISILVALLAMYSIYQEFNKKCRTAYTTLLLPVSKSKILFAKVLTLLIFFIITYSLITLVDIIFLLMLTNWMLPSDIDYLMRNLAYMTPNLQFEVLFISIIKAIEAIGVGFLFAITTKSFWGVFKIFIPILVIGFILLGQQLVAMFFRFEIAQVIGIITPLVSIICSFILFNKKISV